MSDFPDYEAAAKLYRLKSYEPKVPERTWEQLAPGAKRTWIKHAVNIVDTALGDRLLYENIEDHPFSPANAWVEDLVDSGTLARVWPKEADGE